MKTYLVTGGAGFIGSNFVKYLVRERPDVKVVVIDKLTYAGNLLNISDDIERHGVVFVHADIGDARAVERVLDEHDPDCIVNFAAESHVDRSIREPRVFLDTNVLGTHTLLEAARRRWRRDDGTWREGRKFVQVSTDEVYGALERDYPEGRNLEVTDAVKAVVSGRHSDAVTYGSRCFSESTPLSPHSPYSASKASADMLVCAYRDTYGMPVNITRCSNNYGPYQFPEKLIPLVINNALHGRDIPVYGAGDNVRDWLYVDDHLRAIEAVAERGRSGEIYNVGGFNERRNIDIVSLIVDIVKRLTAPGMPYAGLPGCDHSRIGRGLIVHVADRPGHDARYAIDPTKIASELGWVPLTPFDQGIELTVRWYLDHPQWVADVTSGAYLTYYEQMYGSRAVLEQ